MFHFHKRFFVSVQGALLLIGLQLGAPICQAQTAPIPLAAIPAGDDAQISERRKAMERQQILCSRPVDLKVSGATLSQLVKQIEAAMPEVSINLRLNPEDKALERAVDEKAVKLAETKLTQFRFELEQKPLGDILQSSAVLAGYEFWVMPDELLITQPKQMTPKERYLAVPWRIFPDNSDSSSSNESMNADRVKGSREMRVVGKLAANELLRLSRDQDGGKKPLALRFGDLSPELQEELQIAINLSKRFGPPMKVPLDAPFALGKLDKGVLSFNLTIVNQDPAPAGKRIINWFVDTSSGGN